MLCSYCSFLGGIICRTHLAVVSTMSPLSTPACCSVSKKQPSWPFSWMPRSIWSWLGPASPTIEPANKLNCTVNRIPKPPRPIVLSRRCARKNFSGCSDMSVNWRRPDRTSCLKACGRNKIMRNSLFYLNDWVLVCQIMKERSGTWCLPEKKCMDQ